MSLIYTSNHHQTNGLQHNSFMNCKCCPYGYHIDLDFIRFCQSIENQTERTNSIKRRKERRRQRQSMEVMLGLTSPEIWNLDQNLPQVPVKVSDLKQRNAELKNWIVEEALAGVVSDFDNAFESSKTENDASAALQNIREQMAQSLQRMKQLEEEVKVVPGLKARIQRLEEDKRLLASDLDQERSVTSKLYRKLAAAEMPRPAAPKRDAAVSCGVVTRTVGVGANQPKTRDASTQLVEAAKPSPETSAAQCQTFRDVRDSWTQSFSVKKVHASVSARPATLSVATATEALDQPKLPALPISLKTLTEPVARPAPTRTSYTQCEPIARLAKRVQCDALPTATKQTQSDSVKLAAKAAQCDYLGVAKATDTTGLAEPKRMVDAGCCTDLYKCAKCEEAQRAEEKAASSKIPRLDSKKFKRQDTYTKITSDIQPVEAPPTPPPPPKSEDVKVVVENETKLSPKPSKPRIKSEPSKEMKAAMKVLNDFLLKNSEDKVTSAMNSAKEIIEQEWFTVSSITEADPLEVEDYLDAIEEYSITLLKFIVNMSDASGNTAMHYAVSHGNFDIVSILLDSKVCNVNKANKAGYSSVMLVSLAEVKSPTHGHVVKRLFQLADVNARAIQHGQTALMLAVSHGKLDTVKMLLEAGADMNIQDEDGSTALMCAAEHGHVAIVKYFLAQPECDSTITDVDGSTALKIALEAGHRDIGVLLYAHEHSKSSPVPSLKSKRTKQTDRKK